MLINCKSEQDKRISGQKKSKVQQCHHEREKDRKIDTYRISFKN